jgi:hypothetical protein
MFVFNGLTPFRFAPTATANLARMKRRADLAVSSEKQ